MKPEENTEYNVLLMFAFKKESMIGMPGQNLKSIETDNVLDEPGSCSQCALQPELTTMLILVQSTPAAHPPATEYDSSPYPPVKHTVPVLG